MNIDLTNSTTRYLIDQLRQKRGLFNGAVDFIQQEDGMVQFWHAVTSRHLADLNVDGSVTAHGSTGLLRADSLREGLLTAITTEQTKVEIAKLRDYPIRNAQRIKELSAQCA